MRYYVGGEIELSKEIPEEEIMYSTGDIFGGIFKRNGKYFYDLDYDEYFVDELEDELNALCEYAQKNGVVLKGSIVGECEGEQGEYFFDGNDYEEFWGNACYIRQMSDEYLIEELKRRGYEVTK